MLFHVTRGPKLAGSVVSFVSQKVYLYTKHFYYIKF